MAGATIRLIGPLIKKLKGLNSKKETIDAFLKSKTAKNPKNKTQKVAAEKRKEKIVKSMERIKKQAIEAKTTSKDGQFLDKQARNRKKQLPDGSQGIGVKDARERSLLSSGATMRKSKFMSVRKKKIAKLEELEEAGKLTSAQKEELKLMRANMAGMKNRGDKAVEDRRSYIKPIVKKAVGGKVYSNIVSRKTGGAIGVGAALRGFGKGYKKG